MPNRRRFDRARVNWRTPAYRVAAIGYGDAEQSYRGFETLSEQCWNDPIRLN
jgi:hypothetical protein